MALTSNGIGSGLDINGLVRQLMELEQRPMTQLAAREGSFQAQLSAFGQVKSALSTLQTATNGLNNANRFSAMRATSSDSSAFTASATNEASKANYSIEVLQIAQGQRVVSNETTAPAVGAGSLTINFGTYAYDTNGDTTGFASSSAVTIDLAEGSTLEDLRDAINDSGENLRASVIDNGTAKQLVISGTGQGAGSAFTLAGTGGLAGFSFDATDPGGSSLDSLEVAQNARVKVDGITLSRDTNTITDALDGITINLLKASENPGTLTVANDRTAAKGAIEAFVKAYNEFNTTMRGLTSYDAENERAAILTGDATARGIQSQVRNALGSVIGGNNGMTSLSAMGVSFQRDGSLTINSAKLDEALNDPNGEVVTFFTGGEGVQGFAGMLSARLDGLLGSGGVLDSRSDGINSSIRSIDRQRESLATRLEIIEKRYRAQFTALDGMVASMLSTSNFLQQQLQNLPTISGNNNRQ